MFLQTLQEIMIFVAFALIILLFFDSWKHQGIKIAVCCFSAARMYDESLLILKPNSCW